MSAVKIAMIDQRINTTADVLELKERMHKTIVVTKNTNLKTALARVKTWIAAKKIHVLKICAHGVIITDPVTRKQAYLVEFCKEGITAVTARSFSELTGRFRNTKKPQAGIELIACGSEEPGATGKSKILIKQFRLIGQGVADAAGTVVKASPDVQLVGERVRQLWTGSGALKKKVVINPGAWEGRVRYFSPRRRRGR